jgi:hypothetical protein
LRATEKQRDDHCRHRDRVHELREVKQCEANRGILGVETSHQLLLRFHQVERWTIEFGGCRNEEDDEWHDAGGHHVPIGQG